MSVLRFGEEDHEERHQPLKSRGTLVELDQYAEFVLDGHLEVLAIGLDQHRIGFSSSWVGVPDRADFAGEADAGGVELDTAFAELVAVTVECVLIVPWIRSVAEVREFAGVEAEQLEQAQVPVVVEVVVEEILLDAVGEAAQVEAGTDPEVVVEVDEHRHPTLEFPEGFGALFGDPYVMEEAHVPSILRRIVLVHEGDDRVEPASQLGCPGADDPGCPDSPAADDVVEVRAGCGFVALLTLSGALGDMGSQALQIIPNLIAEHDDLGDTFDRVRKPVVEVPGVQIRGGNDPVRESV